MGNASGGAGGNAAWTIGIVAGEASGDALAAELIIAFRAQHPQVHFVGIAGPRMEAAGCVAWASTEALAVRGLVEVLAHLPRLLRIRRQFRRRLLASGARLFIGVDAPDFNLGLARQLKRRGLRTIHFVSPSIWAWRQQRLITIGRAVDRMLALFPFEPPLYEAAGIPVTYVGHPMAQNAATAATRRETRELLQLKAATPVFALLPGSRMSEIEMHTELLLATMQLLHEARPDAQFLVPFVTRATRDLFETEIHRTNRTTLPIRLLYGHAEDALRAADVGIVASGTATLEAALARCPHVIFYKLTALSAYLIRRRLLLPYVGLPNILARRFVVPELIQESATPRNLAQTALNLFDDTVTRHRLEALFAGFAEDLKRDTGALAANAVADELARAGVRP